MTNAIQSPVANAGARTSSTLLDHIIPDRTFADQISVSIRAAPEAIFLAFSEVRLDEMPLASFLGKVRYLPARLVGKQPPAPSESSFVQGVREGGWVTLAESAGREIVYGGIGKYHQVVDQEPLALRDRGEFFAFDLPDYQKLAISVRVEPGVAGDYRFIMEHRTLPLSEAAKRKFRAYWLVIKPMGAFVSRQLLLAVKRRAEAAAAQA